ncbi:MAG: transposase, partial [Verrucomicrobiota bacterium JB023]|nr:transposase [Verrucomicrobiota bacterium JB023]
PPAAWPCPPEPYGLEPYRHLGDLNGSSLLRDPGCLRKQIELLYAHLAAENVQHAEIRCSPGNYSSPGRSPWQVLTDIITGFEEVAASFPACSPVSLPVPGAGDPATFIPYNEEKEFSQTWRDLPHRHQEGATAFVTFRLADSLPKDRVKSWLAERELFLAKHPKPWSEETWRNYQRRFPRQLENWLDRSHGSCLLRNPENASLVAQALHHFDGERYILDHFVVMPNHVHVLVKPLGHHKLTDILHSWKSFTARAINKRENREGQLWQHESYDHLVRSERQLQHYRHYIEENPEKAGLSAGFLLGKGRGLVVGASISACPEVGTSFPACPDVGTSIPACPDVTPPVPGEDQPMPSETLAITSEPSQRLAPTINLIIIGTRQPGGDYRTQIIKHLMLAVTAAEHFGEGSRCRVVGVDLAGFEDPSTRSHYFRDDFLPVHRAGLSLTVHAGENDDAEAIWSALFDLSAMRLGHGLSLHESPALLRSVAQRRIAIEMCPYANLQIKGYPLDDEVSQAPEKARYPLLRYLRAGVAVTVNTDNIGISAASLSDNLLLAARLCPGLTRLDVLHLLRNAVEHSFLEQNEREELLARIQIPQP